MGLGVSSVAAVRTGVVDLGGGIQTSLSAASVAALGQGSLAYVHSLLSVSQSSYDNALISFTAQSEAELMELYTNIANATEANMTTSYEITRRRIDYLAAVEEAINDNGYTVPADSPSVKSLVDAHIAVEW